MTTVGTNPTPRPPASALGVVPRGVDGVVHQFTPIVSVTLREDGRYDWEVDWGGAYFGSYDLTNDDVPEDGDAAVRAIAAVDAWVATLVPKTIIPAAP